MTKNLNTKLHLRIMEVVKFSGMSYETIRRLRAEGKFPEPILFGGRQRWVTKDLRAWLNAGDKMPVHGAPDAVEAAPKQKGVAAKNIMSPEQRRAIVARLDGVLASVGEGFKYADVNVTDASLAKEYGFSTVQIAKLRADMFGKLVSSTPYVPIPRIIDRLSASELRVEELSEQVAQLIGQVTELSKRAMISSLALTNPSHLNGIGLTGTRPPNESY